MESRDAEALPLSKKVETEVSMTANVMVIKILDLFIEQAKQAN